MEGQLNIEKQSQVRLTSELQTTRDTLAETEMFVLLKRINSFIYVH